MFYKWSVGVDSPIYLRYLGVSVPNTISNERIRRHGLFELRTQKPKNLKSLGVAQHKGPIPALN